MKEWRFWLAEQRGTLLAFGIFVVMFAIYLFNHPAIANRGFNVDTVSNVVQTAANKGVLLAFVAMAQALVVITAGIDLSVGMTFTLTNCLASWIVVGSPLQTGLGVLGVLAVGAACGALNGVIVIYRPAAADRDDHRHRRDLLRHRAGCSAPSPAAASTATSPTCSPARCSTSSRRASWCWPWSCSSSGCRSAARSPAAPPMPSARRRSPPTCRACRSSGRSSSPTRCRACSLRWAACS